MSNFKFIYEPESPQHGNVIFTSERKVLTFAVDMEFMYANPLFDFISMLAGFGENGSPGLFNMYWKSEQYDYRVLVERRSGNAAVKVFEVEKSESLDEEIQSMLYSESKSLFAVELPYDDLVETILAEAERNVRKFGIFGISRSSRSYGTQFPLADYFHLKGLVDDVDEKGLIYSNLEDELKLLEALKG